MKKEQKNTFKSFQKISIILLLSFLCVCSNINILNAEVTYIYPSDDTWIASGSEANNPNGGDTELWVANASATPSNYIAYGLFKFTDFSSIPPGSTINSATIKIYCDITIGLFTLLKG